MNRKTTLYISTALLTLAVIIVSVNAVLALRSLQTLNESQSWVSHTWEVLDTVDRMMSSLKDAESGSRGYLLTGDRAYLVPYKQARIELPGELTKLQSLISDNPRERPRAIEMRAMINTRLELLQRGIDERATGSLDSVSHLVLSGTGQYEMNSIRGVAAEMQQDEQGLLADRTRTSISAERRGTFTVVVASTLDLLLIVFVSWSLVREQKLRITSEEAKHRLQMLQTISDVALTQLPTGELTAELLKRVRIVVEADATVLAMLRDKDLVVEAASGINVTRGTPVGADPNDPLRLAAVENRVIIVNYPIEVGGVAPSSGHLTARMLFGSSGDPAARPLRTLLVIPLLASGQVTGVLVAARHSPDAFLLQDEELLRVVADRIAIALDRASAYESEREARRVAEHSAEEVRALNAELEQRVSQRTSELEATNKELEAFSYSVSHDLRAPLRTVDGFSLALEEDYSAALDDAGRDFVRRIREGVQRMGQLIDALLQLSRITRAELSRETVNISALGEELGYELQQENPDRQIEFRIHPDLRAQGDPRLLRVGLENLLGNAVKFTARQAKAVIELGQSAESGEFYIRDNGAGFDMQYAGKLFTAFQRLHGEKDFKGSGIGLATVARVIRRHHGTIRAEGKVDHGATFWFRLG